MAASHRIPSESNNHTANNFFKSDSQKEILELIRLAGPINDIQRLIKAAHAKNEAHLESTLIQAIKIAAMGLDQTMWRSNSTEISKGLTERLLAWYKELFPQNEKIALAAAINAMPILHTKEKVAREKANLIAVTRVFNAIKKMMRKQQTQ